MVFASPVHQRGRGAERSTLEWVLQRELWGYPVDTVLWRFHQFPPLFADALDGSPMSQACQVKFLGILEMLATILVSEKTLPTNARP